MSAASAPVDGDRFLRRLRDHGFDFFTGVPCSLFGSLYDALQSLEDAPVIAAVREDDAVGQAAGAYMAGKRPVVLMQNSGLGNALNGIVSLNQIYAIPMLLLVSWRGFEGKDAPEHLVMGRAMPDILRAIDLPFLVFEPGALEDQLAVMRRHLDERRTAALIVRKDTIA